MSAPKSQPIECVEEQRLIEQLKAANTTITSIHNEEFEAVVAGDLTVDVSAPLQEARERRSLLVESLKAHLAKHGC